MWNYKIVEDSLETCANYIRYIENLYTFESHSIYYKYLVDFNTSHKNSSIHEHNYAKNLLLLLEDKEYHKKYIRDIRKIKINKIEKL